MKGWWWFIVFLWLLGTVPDWIAAHLTLTIAVVVLCVAVVVWQVIEVRQIPGGKDDS